VIYPVRTLIISDIHANLNALEAVLAHAGQFERVFCLGDIVGYGPDPNECVEIVRNLPNLTYIMGNHDAGLLGFIDLYTFNQEAMDAIHVQSGILSAEARDFLELASVRTEESQFTLAHGSPRKPIWEYIIHVGLAWLNFREFTTPICLVGHTHIPCIFEEESEKQVRLLLPGHGDMWRSDKRFILNPGSVGQPRDRNPKAAYVIYDDQEDNFQFQRVAYDFKPVQARARALGIPERHAYRLEFGL